MTSIFLEFFEPRVFEMNRRLHASESQKDLSIDINRLRWLRQIRRGTEAGAQIQAVSRQLQQPRQEYPKARKPAGAVLSILLKSISLWVK